MEKVANLDIEDSFFMGVSQKIRLTGDREMTYEQIDAFQKAVAQRAKNECGYSEFTFSLYRKDDRYGIANFFKKYSAYVTPTEHGIRLNDDVTCDDILKIYPIGALSTDTLLIFLDLSIGKQVFGVENDGETIEF